MKFSVPVLCIIALATIFFVLFQELREEVSSLLEFREAVSAALPHIQPTPEAPLSSPYIHHHHHHPPITTDSRSLAGGASTKSEGGGNATTTGGGAVISGGVSDSGFTDKNWWSGSMGTKTSSNASSSATEEAGGANAAEGSTISCGVIGATSRSVNTITTIEAEDELWQLLETIERKGSRLQRELSSAKARLSETNSEGGHEIHSDPAFPRPPYSEATNPDGGLWPLSLPPYYQSPPSPPSPLVCSLLSRASLAEREASEARDRLADLHACLSLVLNEKRRLERELKYRTLPGEEMMMMGGYRHESYPPLVPHYLPPYHQYPPPPHTVPSSHNPPFPGSHYSPPAHNSFPNSSSNQSVQLPRLLKVPIKESRRDPAEARRSYRKKSETSIGKSPAVDGGDLKRQQNSERGAERPLPSSEGVLDDAKSRMTRSGSFRIPLPTSDYLPADLAPVTRERSRSMSQVRSSPSKSMKPSPNPVRVMGSSLPAGLRVVGGRISVTPNRSRIASILREKNVLELQRQLLHTVMEAEVSYK